ncbi:MAG: TIGR03546 family protein [Oligoflexia bacterium]|nr:TIGR03546 family protein [Oligoflexia bacterium]
MTLLLKQLFNFIKLLNSEKGATSIAAGMVCGMILGFTPAFSLQTLLVLIILFFFRIQIGAAFTMAFFFKLMAYALDPAFGAVGAAVLEADGLRPLFTTLYNVPIVPLTRFNNSIVMGSGVVSLLLALPMFFVFRMLVAAYRLQVMARFEKTVFWKAVKATGFYKWYVKYEELHG